MLLLKGRQILDSVLIANECLDNRIKCGEPGVLCKLDIEKAYDRVDWNFLLYLLKRCGFGERWCSWIKHCISSVMEAFSRMISAIYSRGADLGLLRGFWGHNRVEVSHLLFADDTLVFCGAEASQISYMGAFLVCFEVVSELKVNLTKSGLILVGSLDDVD